MTFIGIACCSDDDKQPYFTVRLAHAHAPRVHPPSYGCAYWFVDDEQPYNMD